MAIPTYEKLFKPILEVCSDGSVLKVRDIIQLVVGKIGLSEEEAGKMLSGGSNTVIGNRVWWSRTFLVKAELLQSPVRGSVQITPLGLQVLEDIPEINVKFLKTLPNFESNWGNGKAKTAKDSSDEEVVSSLTPREMLEEGYKQIRESLIDDLAISLKSISPIFFEKLVVDVLIAMGYGGGRKEAGQAIGRSGDGGIDGVINEDKLGLDTIYIQAKHWQNNVGGPEINSFVGSLEANKANKGVFFTTSSFTAQAKEITAKVHKKIILIDGRMLANLMIDNNVGVVDSDTYVTKRLDSDYFIEE